MKVIVLASNNKHKLAEISHLAAKKKIKILSLADVGFNRDIKETGETLAENALIKVRAVRKKAGSKIIIADDTGLEVEYLAKAPGVYSARFAGPDCNFMDNNRKLLRLLRGVKMKDRKAVFRTVVAISFPDGKEAVAEGRVEGYISANMRGSNGFGYDPVFYLPGLRKTYAQLTMQEKNNVSHRKRAVLNAIKIIAAR